MSHATSPSFVRQLESLYEGGSAAGLSDRQLIERFAAARDEAAFSALVARHGPMVLGVCRQLLGNGHDAEDAFQAVFLVLARKAGSLRAPELLGNWLYGVALRAARNARRRLARRCRTEAAGAASRPEARPAVEAGPLIEREQAEALHAEIDRLPGAFRAPLVLCYFEGLALDEAAHRLRWPVGTLRSRLARARDKLRRGLTRRGFAPSGTAIAALPAPRSARASVSSLLCDSTARAAIRFAARRAAGEALSASAAAIAQEVLRTMLFHKLRLAATSILLLAVVAGAAFPSLNAVARSREGEPPGEPIAQTARTEPRPPDSPRPPERQTTITGRVLDSAGKPLPNARVAALADRKKQIGDIDRHPRNVLMGTSAADAEGRFVLAFPAIPAGRLHDLKLIATAPGRGLGTVELKIDAERQETSIALSPEKPVEGRLVDVQGQPAAGVVVRLASLNSRPELQPYDTKGGPSLWPAPATTDTYGRFRVLGLAPNAPVTLEVEDPRFARHAFSIHKKSGRLSEAEIVVGPNATVTLRPAQALDLHVVDADDGRPVAGARAWIQSTQGQRYIYMGEIDRVRTDGQGRVRVVPWPGDVFVIRIYPPEGEPYLPTSLDVNWPKAAVRHAVEAKLPRGVLVRGRLVEDPAGTPVAGGWVVYHQARRGKSGPRRLVPIEAVSGPDGTFTLVVPSGPGHLLVQGPSADYLHVTTSNVEMGVSYRPSFHLYPDAHAVLDIKDGEAPRPLELRLRRGVTVTGRVVAPDGQPVAEAFAFGRSYVPFGEGPYPMTLGSGTPPQIQVKDGRFEIPGCDPETPSTFYFLDVKDRLGASVELSGQSAANGPVTVRLRPAASASIRLKGLGRKAPDYADAWPQLSGLRLIITPGPDWEEMRKNIDVVPGDWAYHINLDDVRDDPPRPGPDGRVTLRNLIPGATYRFRGREFIPEPGQTIDLGEIVVEARRR
jgi:RNA polymerase sigma factor (sigma-70 family)